MATIYKSIMRGVQSIQTGLDNEKSEPRCIPPGINTLTFYVKQVGGAGSINSQLQVAKNPADVDADWIDFGDPIATGIDVTTTISLPAPIGLNAIRLSAGNSVGGTIEFTIYGI